MRAGTAEPLGRDAVGWRVGVYWRDDHVFYPGIVDDVHLPTGRHIILYDDGAPLPCGLQAGQQCGVRHVCACYTSHASAGESSEGTSSTA